MKNHAHDQQGWIGVDLDGTLAHYDGWKGVDHIGQPIPLMLQRVKDWIAEGREVRIFTARVCRLLSDNPVEREDAEKVIRTVQNWLFDNGLPPLRVTCVKDFSMQELWDDRAVQVEKNTGIAFVHPHSNTTTP